MGKLIVPSYIYTAQNNAWHREGLVLVVATVVFGTIRYSNMLNRIRLLLK